MNPSLLGTQMTAFKQLPPPTHTPPFHFYCCYPTGIELWLTVCYRNQWWCPQSFEWVLSYLYISVQFWRDKSSFHLALKHALITGLPPFPGCLHQINCRGNSNMIGESYYDPRKGKLHLPGTLVWRAKKMLGHWIHGGERNTLACFWYCSHVLFVPETILMLPLA